jgi:hypothetical protein
MRSDWTYDRNTDSAFNRTGKSLEYNKIANEIPTHGNFFTDTISTLYNDGKGIVTTVYTDVKNGISSTIGGVNDDIQIGKRGIFSTTESLGNNIEKSLDDVSGNLTLPLMVGGGALLLFILMKK